MTAMYKPWRVRNPPKLECKLLLAGVGTVSVGVRNPPKLECKCIF